MRNEPKEKTKKLSRKLIFAALAVMVPAATALSCASPGGNVNGPTSKAEISVTPEPSAEPETSAAVSLAASMPPGYEYEKVKEAFLEYLNFKAWCNPSEMPQTAYECTYEVYREPKKEGLKDISNKIGFRCLTADGMKWYTCTPVTGSAPLDWTKWTGEFYFSESPFALSSQMSDIQYLGKDTILVPAVTKPEFAPEEKETALEELKRQTARIYQDLKTDEKFKRLYWEDFKLKIIVSDFSMVKKLNPYIYVIINDKIVFEINLYTHQLNEFARVFFAYNHNEDPYSPYWEFEEFHGHALHSLEDIDQNRFERIKEIAVLDYVYEGEGSTEAEE